jgi:hypothetical protein
MSRIRLAALAAAAVCMLLLGGGSVAQAQTPKFGKKVPVTGTKGFTGTYTIERFVRAGDRIFAVGTLRGTLRGNQRVRREDVRIPVALAAAPQAAQIPPTPGACSVLNLTLGPLDLNLLGLRVRLSRVDLRIEAIPSPLPGSGLLGDLLCGIANLLNPTASTPLGQVTQLLNALLALAPPRAG